MISSPKSPAPAATVANIDAKRVATNEQAIPLPYFGGRTWLPFVWAQSNVYNPKTKAITTKVGKSKQVTGFDYYGSLVGVLGCCLIDYIEGIEVAGKLVWSGTIERDGGHVHHSGDIVVDGVGTFRLHWGTSNAPANDNLVLSYDAGTGLPYCEITVGGVTTRENHPAYRRIPWVEVLDCYFGNNNATPPTIRFLVERAARFTGLPEDRTREGTNPVTVIAELIGDEFFGLGMPEVVHVASALSTADDVRRDTAVAVPGDPGHIAAMGFLSPLLDRQQPAQSVFARLMEYYDGWVRPSGDQFYFGRFPHDGVTPVGLTELSYHDFVKGKRPRFEPADDELNSLITEVNVAHLDRDGANGEIEKALTPVPNPAARTRLGFANPKTFQRPFIITTYQALEQGNQIARLYSRDEEACEASVRREKAAGLRAGDRFLLTDLYSASSQIVRITQRVDPADGGEVQLSLVLERGLAPIAYVPPPNPNPILPDPEIVPIVNARMFQLPTLFDNYEPAAAVVALAERPGQHVAGFTVNFSVSDVTYDEVATVGKWAVRGTLNAGVTNVAASVTVNASGFDIALLAEQSDAAKNDDTLLLIVGYEIMSIGAVTALGGGNYAIDVLRGRRGSVADAHLINAEVFIIPRADLTVLQHAEFPRAIANRFFKLATYTPEEEEALADALKIEFTFDDTTVDAPGAFGAYAQAEALFISWTYPDPPNDSTIIATDIWIRGAAAPPPDPSVDVPDHTVRGTAFTLGGLAAGTHKWFWVQNRDRLGTRSTLVGPKDETAAAAATGNFIDYIFKRNPTQPATPVGDTPAGWSDGPPAGTDPLWMCSGEKTAAGVLVGVWSDPVRLDGNNIQVEYSIDGATAWHSVFVAGDIYMRTSTDGGVTWSAAMRIIGEQGIPGPGLVFVGDYDGANTYYDTTSRRDVVKSGGNYYLANNPAKSGTATWGAPGGGDWTAPDATYKFVATALLLAENATIIKTLVMGDGATGDGGIIRSAGATAFATGSGFWMNPRNGANKTEFRVGDPAAAYFSFDGTNLVASIGGTGTKLILDIDSDFVGPNPPARMRFGTMKASATGAGVTTLDLTDGVIGVSAGLKFHIGNLAFGLGYTYGIETTAGEARFKKVRSADGYFDSGGLQVVGARKAAVADAPNNANESMLSSDWAGTDTISLTALNDHLNAVDVFINSLGNRINDLRNRMKATGGHGLIAD